MLLATRCPFCETVFRLQPAHLALRRGLVRCGHCQEVFDASSSLFETDESGDLASAKPVAPEIASALTSGEPLPGTVAAPVSKPVEAHPVEVHPVEVHPVEVHPVEVHPVEAQSVATHPLEEHPAEAHPVEQQAAEEHSAVAHAADEHPAAEHPAAEAPAAEHLAAERPVEPEPAPAAPSLEPHAPPPGGHPNFGSEAWNPWAPAPDAAIDDRLRHSTKNLPYRPLSEAATAKLKAAIEREAKQRAESAAAHSPPADSPTIYDEPTPEGTADGERHAPRWHSVEPIAEEEIEPGFATIPAVAAMSPSAHLNASTSAGVNAHDGEPHFGTPASEPSFSSEPFAATPPENEAEPFAVVRETREAEPRRIGWIILGTLVAISLLIVLLAQLAWWQRETVMVYWPRSQMLFAQACAKIGCTVAPPRDIDGLQVEPSDLRQVDGPHKLELKMPLRNRFNVALAYPAVELTLLDAQNNVAVRRVLLPEDYVTPGTPIAAGLPPRTTQTMIVRLDTGSAIASNFRVLIFYP